MVYVTAIQSLATLIVGVVAGVIAWRQWRISQDRLVLDLFERRFQVFRELTRTIADAFSKAAVQIGDLANFDAGAEKARYLFGPEVYDYLRQVRPKIIAIHVLQSAPPGQKNENALVDALDEMHAFYEKLAVMLTPYLRMSTKSQSE